MCACFRQWSYFHNVECGVLLRRSSVALVHHTRISTTAASATTGCWNDNVDAHQRCDAFIFELHPVRIDSCGTAGRHKMHAKTGYFMAGGALYLFAHSLVSHKEHRFMLPLMPILCILAGNHISKRLEIRLSVLART